MSSIPLKRLEIASVAPGYWWYGHSEGLESVELYTGRYASQFDPAEILNPVREALLRRWPYRSAWLVIEHRRGPPPTEQSEQVGRRIQRSHFRRVVDQASLLLKVALVGTRWVELETGVIGLAAWSLSPIAMNVFNRLEWPSAVFLLSRGDGGDLLDALAASAGRLPGRHGLSGAPAVLAKGGVMIAFSDDRDLAVCDLISNDGEPIADLFRPWVDPSAEGLIG